MKKIEQMKKILLIGMLLTTFLGIQAQTAKKMLVTYFSWSGSTKNLAEEIQRQTHADIYRIEPLVPYTDDYQTLAYQISNREKEENARPALKDTLATASYETLNDIVNATPNSEHLDGLGTRGSQSSYTQVVRTWLHRIGISGIVSSISNVTVNNDNDTRAYTLSGVSVENIDNAERGVYIVGGKKIIKR